MRRHTLHQIVENTKYFNIFKIKEPTKIYIDENGNKVEIKKETVPDAKDSKKPQKGGKDNK